MCSGRGYHVLGDFSFKTIGCEFTPSFVYLFMYPFVDGYLALWHARAPARIVFLVPVFTGGGSSWYMVATRLRAHELNVACQLEPFSVHIALLCKTFRCAIDMQPARLSFNFATLEQDLGRIILCEFSVEAGGTVIYCPRCNLASVVDLQLHHEVTLNQIVSAAWVFCCSVGALNVDARHLLKRMFQYVHLDVVAE
jgi:hypothetical protein